MVEKAGKLSVSESLHQVPTGSPIIHIFLSSTHIKTVEKNLLKCQWGIVFPFHHIQACVFNLEWKEMIK